MMKKLTLFTAIVGLCCCFLQANDYLEIQFLSVSPSKEPLETDAPTASTDPERIRFEQNSALYLTSEPLPNPPLHEPSGYYYGTRVHARLVDNQVKGTITVTEFQGFMELDNHLTPIVRAYEQEFVLKTHGEEWTVIPLHERAAAQLRWIRHGAGEPASDLSANKIVITTAYQKVREDTLQFTWNRDGQDTSLFLDTSNFIGDEDIEQAEATSPNQLTLRLTPTGARKLEKSTSKAAVTSATLIAILVDNQIQSVPHIREPVTGNTLDIVGLPPELQSELIEHLNGKAAQRIEKIKQSHQKESEKPETPKTEPRASTDAPSDLAVELTQFLLVPLPTPEELKAFSEEQQQRFIEKREQAWQEIQRLYGHYLDGHFKESELRKILDFYSSSTGKKFAEMMNLQGKAGQEIRKGIIQIQSEVHSSSVSDPLPDLAELTDGQPSQKAQTIVSDIHLTIVPSKESLSSRDDSEALLTRYKQGQKKFERLYAHYVDQTFSRKELEEVSTFTSSDLGKRYFKVITYQDKTDKHGQDIQQQSLELLNQAYDELRNR